jgi:hypothetical protein
LKFEKGEETELKKFEDILVQCIEDIKAGRSSIEECLDRYSSMREQLEPLLKIALEIREPPDIKPSPSFKVKARAWLMDQIYGRQAVTKWPWSRYDSQVKPIPYIGRLSMARVIVAAVTVGVVVLAVLGVIYGIPTGQPLETGTLKLYLSDAPLDAENVTGVYITINEIQYHRDGQWITCEEFEGNQTYNLLELTGGNSALLGELTLPAGNYTQIRFMLDIPEKGPHPVNPGCYIEFADNSTEPLFVPSGGETGYKATGRFEVAVNETVEVTADFDVRKPGAVHVAGSRYILNPTIKLIVNDQSDVTVEDSDESEQVLEIGTLELYLSDAPIDANNVTGVYITINEIQYHLGSQWITCEEFMGNQTYNLLELTGGNSTLLGNLTLPAGSYTQIRFMLDIPEMGSHKANPGCYVEFADNSTTPLFVPSGNETGYKAIGRFEVAANETVEVTADFDVRKAVVVAGSSYILKPTIRLIVNSQAGNISGSITNGSNYTDIIVFAYEDGTWAEKEADEPAGQKSRFPDAITSGKMDEEGGYRLALLTAGTYDLVIAGYDGADFGEVLGFISDVEVESDQTTIQNIDTDALEASL